MAAVRKARALIIGLAKVEAFMKQELEAVMPAERQEFLRSLTTEKLQEALASERSGLEKEGIALENLLIDGGNDPSALQKNGDVVREHLKKERYDVVVIGAGVRLPPSNFPLLEYLTNIVHSHAPGAKIAYNTYPLDTADAIRRALATNYLE
ncbi:unnamed protein product [Durusdinium trenchii]|uniref:Uncharacterized protein n=2 Tax=Durusdinium trenchii TaxID=1381693 RepID=A0ABP0RIB1_9DINO